MVFIYKYIVWFNFFIERVYKYMNNIKLKMICGVVKEIKW